MCNNARGAAWKFETVADTQRKRPVSSSLINNSDGSHKLKKKQKPTEVHL